MLQGGVYGLLYLKDKQLAQKQQYTHSILQTIDVAIIEVTEDGILNSVKSAFINIFGYTQKETVGQHFTKLLSEENIEKGRHDFQQLMEGNSLPDKEWNIYDKEGNPISLLINANTLQNKKKHFS